MLRRELVRDRGSQIQADLSSASNNPRGNTCSRRSCINTMESSWSWAIVLTGLLFLTSLAQAFDTHECDWSGSGLALNATVHDVQQINIDCDSGTVAWSYPRNALHITFTAGQRKTEFRLCLRIKMTGNGVNIYQDTPEKLVPLLMDNRPEYERSTLGSETHVHEINRRLEIERTSPKEEHCFVSLNNKASVYLEAAFNPLSLKYVATIDYRIEDLPEHRHHFHHVLHECKKCEAGEVLAAFCSDDFAVKARMLDVTPDSSTQETYIDVAVGVVYRQRDFVFRPGKHSRYYGLVATPMRCGVQKIDGHYLITGQIVLGRAQLGCIAHMSVVKRLAREVMAAGIGPCDMSPLAHHRYIE